MMNTTTKEKGSFIVQTIQPPDGTPLDGDPVSIKMMIPSPANFKSGSLNPQYIDQNALQSVRSRVKKWVQGAANCGCDGIKLSGSLGFEVAMIIINEMNRLAPALCLSITIRGTIGGNARFPTLNHSLSPSSYLVNWVAPFDPLPLFSLQLKAFAKSGIWNHVNLPPVKGEVLQSGMIQFALANPNLMHSWTVPSDAQDPLEKRFEKMDGLSARFFTYPLLPGRPVWHYLLTDSHLLVYLVHFGNQKMVRWWLPPGQRSPIVLGSQLEYHYVPPEKLTAEQLDDICQLVAAGGSVDTRWVRHNLKRAFLIAYVTEMGRIVGNSSLKHPRPEYIDALNRQAGMDLSGYLERGYTSVRPEYRGLGLGTRLLKGLTSRVRGRAIFSLIAEDNTATQKIAIRNNTRKIATFFSQRAKKEMGVWMPAEND